MKKQLFFIILLGVVELLAGCRPEGKEPETGVSIGLARQRKQDISNLQYRLKFRLLAEFSGVTFNHYKGKCGQNKD